MNENVSEVIQEDVAVADPGTSGANSNTSHPDSKKKELVVFKKFITCSFPRYTNPSSEGTHRKYEIEVTFSDENDTRRKKRVKFGDVSCPDVREARSSFKHAQLYLKKRKQLVEKYKRYVLNSLDFDIATCTKEQWPIRRSFWEANYCHLSKDLDDEEAVGKPISLERVVEQLQKLYLRE